MPNMKVLAAILVAAAAAWPATSPAVPSKTAVSKGAAARSKPDAEVEREIRAKFAKSKINEDKFQVHVQGGVATLEGKTEIIQHKGVATRLAKGGGAAAVANHIQISDAARNKAAANLETGRRRVQIKRGEARSEASTGAR